MGPARTVPALPAAAAFLIGVILGIVPDTPLSQPAGVFLLLSASAAGWVARRGGGPAICLLVPVILLAGLVRGAVSRAGAADELRSWLPGGEGYRECHLVGTVLRSPERSEDGERVLLVRGTPDPGRTEIRIRLRIRASPPEAMEGLDMLRRGDRVRAWCRLGVPRRSGNPDSGDPLESFRSRRLFATGTVKSARLVELLRRGTPSVPRALDSLHARARGNLDRIGPDRMAERGLAGAMVLGDRELLPAERRRTLRDAGLVHLTAISGLHLSLVVLVMLGLLRRLRIHAIAETVLAWTAIPTLAHLVGSRPPVLRASITACAAIAGRGIGRRGEPLNTLGLAAAVLASASPWIVLDPGYQLSFLATAGILLLAGPLSRILPLPRVVALPLSVSMAAYLFTAPVCAMHFGRLAPVALGSNLFAAPLCMLVLATGTAAAVMGGIPEIGDFAVDFSTRACAFLLQVGDTAAAVPHGSFTVAPPAAIWTVAYYAALAALVRSMHHAGGRPLRWRRTIPAGWSVCLVSAILHMGPPPQEPGPGLQVILPDVGQGQTVCLRSRDSGFLLVDAGGGLGRRYDVGERVLAPLLARTGCRRVEILALTHLHADHMGGARAILESFEVGELWIGPGTIRHPAIRVLADLAANRGTAVVVVRNGYTAMRGDLRVEVLHPDPGDMPEGSNDHSLCVRLRSGRNTVLVTGDLEERGERMLLERYPEPDATVLVAGHHGARRSSTSVFLDRVRPEIAVISAGAGNRFGHPHPEVLARFEERGIRVLRTDRDGLIHIVLDGSRRGAEGFLRRRRERE